MLDRPPQPLGNPRHPTLEESVAQDVIAWLKTAPQETAKAMMDQGKRPPFTADPDPERDRAMLGMQCFLPDGTLNFAGIAALAAWDETQGRALAPLRALQAANAFLAHSRQVKREANRG